MIAAGEAGLLAYSIIQS